MKKIKEFDPKRDIQDIIDELRVHPECLSLDVFTVADCVEYLNEQIAGEHEEDIVIGIDDLTKNDIKVMERHITSNMEAMWRNADCSFYPDLDDFDDLHKKIEREIKLAQIL